MFLFSITDELSQLKSLLPVWRMLESRLEQLQNDLKMDEKTMETLDSSLTNGNFSDQTAASVREVAKLLSETTTTVSFFFIFVVSKIWSFKKECVEHIRFYKPFL